MLWTLIACSLALAGPTDSDGDSVLDHQEQTGDTDGDGTPDVLDSDDDGDGIPTITENWDMAAFQCTGTLPVGNGVLTTDRDSDTIPDYLDADDDNDGVPTLYEVLANTDPLCTDSDLDNVSDGDEWCDHPCVHPLSDAQYRSPRNTDNDTLIDALDEDDDNDGIITFDEGDDDIDGIAIGANGPLSVGCSVSEIIRCDFQPDGLPNYIDTNSDGDCYLDGESGVDTTPDPDHTVSETPFADQDNDGVPDIFDCLDNDGCNADSDGDGLDNCDERDVYFSNPYSADTDNDGIPDAVEAGPLNNPTNSDGTQCPYTDLLGNTSNQPCYDIRDPDDDDDGVPTSIELCTMPPSVGGDCADQDRYVWPTSGTPEPPNTDRFEPANADSTITIDLVPDYLDTDDDGDGVATADEDSNDNGDPVDDDSDGDGIPDYLDVRNDGPCGDSDDDGLPNAIEAYFGLDEDGEDSDDDGVPDAEELGSDLLDFLASDTGMQYCQDPTLDADIDGNPDLDDVELTDTDADGRPNALDTDDDGDGILTATELENSAAPPTLDHDTDGDGTPDYLDLDSDDDGLLDEVEGAADDNQDGTPNYLEPYEPGETQDPPDLDDPGCGCTQAPLQLGAVVLLLPLALRRRR
ncbi:MAG: hypothetical protein KC912_10710 [Proteobacteria bacterium]|nr:hypothetical protein [Pseudomonadota bacterium]